MAEKDQFVRLTGKKIHGFKTTQKGHTLLACTIRVVCKNGEAQDFEHAFFFTEKSAPYSLEALEALGVDVSKFPDDLSGFGSVTCEGKIGIDSYSGELKILGIYKPKEEVYEEPQGAMRDFLRAQAKLASAQSRLKAPVKKKEQAQGDDDEIPF